MSGDLGIGSCIKAGKAEKHDAAGKGGGGHARRWAHFAREQEVDRLSGRRALDSERDEAWLAAGQMAGRQLERR